MVVDLRGAPDPIPSRASTLKRKAVGEVAGEELPRAEQARGRGRTTHLVDAFKGLVEVQGKGENEGVRASEQTKEKTALDGRRAASGGEF
eukprot:CAMPEP_0181174126 /NCGR_PEP_ID=MMETSP1096-20121128/3369_1 /TAXON_ID=156174 ORGANISM="Chrysochromulina ericina, Strain CCMP281" /NCGR_SAMPLE_ID=MMETSP1096 /ASSEMBLY_ACC=CAM_ASM_000453 /LENGTH=89 /DNA_ID=CAMNT_0023262005 /DNA_START=275 /DNA_END=545 /DNA_ORIENTATION=-